jgi:hypothetical protein
LTVEVNHRRRELADPRVRRAIAHAIDRDFVVDTIFLGYAKAAKLKAKSGGSRGAAPRWTREVGLGIKTPAEAIKVRSGASPCARARSRLCEAARTAGSAAWWRWLQTALLSATGTVGTCRLPSLLRFFHLCPFPCPRRVLPRRARTLTRSARGRAT